MGGALIQLEHACILSHRPLKQKTIKELEEIFKSKVTKKGDLTELVWELKFRRTARAKQLYRQAPVRT